MWQKKNFAADFTWWEALFQCQIQRRRQQIATIKHRKSILATVSPTGRGGGERTPHRRVFLEDGSWDKTCLLAGRKLLNLQQAAAGSVGGLRRSASQAGAVCGRFTARDVGHLMYRQRSSMPRPVVIGRH